MVNSLTSADHKKLMECNRSLIFFFHLIGNPFNFQKSKGLRGLLQTFIFSYFPLSAHCASFPPYGFQGGFFGKEFCCVNSVQVLCLFPVGAFRRWGAHLYFMVPLPPPCFQGGLIKLMSQIILSAICKIYVRISRFKTLS